MDDIKDADNLIDPEKVNTLFDRTLERLKNLFKPDKPLGAETEGDAEIPAPIKKFFQISESILPKTTSIAELTASISDGALTTDLAVTEGALETSEETVEEFAAKAESIIGRTRKGVLPRLYTRLFRKAVTPDELNDLSDAAAANNLKGAMRLQLTQARADAVQALNERPPTQALARAMNKMKLIDRTTGETLSQGAQALRLADIGADGTGEISDETQAIIDQVKELREQLSTPLFKSSRYLKLASNINRAFAEQYPMIHGAIHMMLFMDATMGGQLSISWENESQAKEYTTMTAKRNVINAKLQSKVSEIELLKKASLRKIRANKLNLLTTMYATNQKISGGYIQESNYIVQSVAEHTMQSIYLSNPIVYDLYFYYSPMLTPSQETSFFSSQGQNSPWILKKKEPIILNQSTARWILEKSNSKNPTALGTGAWIAKEDQANKSESIFFSQKISIPQEYPINAVDHTWYNVYRKGNWIFNPTFNTFFQYQPSPITSTNSPQGDSSETLKNSIFTEYIPPLILNEKGDATYVIQVEMKIYQAEFPFFAGIFFNGGRWISGSKDLRTQHRLFGLYGDLKKNISLYGTETAYISNKNQLKEKTSITALEQVFASSEVRKNWGEKYRSLIPNPLYPTTKENSIPLEVGKTYILTAATQSTRIMLMIEEKTDEGVLPVFGPYTIIHRNPFVFLYHNIGFIAGGCSAGFKLLQPKQLVYSEKSLEEFKRKIGLSETTPVETA